MKTMTKSVKVKIILSFLLIMALAISSFGVAMFNKSYEDSTKIFVDNSILIAEDVSSQITEGMKSTNNLYDLIDEVILTSGKGVRDFYNAKEGKVSNEDIKRLADEYGIAELNIIKKADSPALIAKEMGYTLTGNDKDIGKNLLIYSNIDTNLGFVYPVEHKMNNVFNGIDEFYTESIRQSNSDNLYYKYGGLAIDDETFIQVGLSADEVIEITKLTSYENILNNVLNLTEEDVVTYGELIDNNGLLFFSTDSNYIGTQYSKEEAGEKYLTNNNHEVMHTLWYDEEVDETSLDIFVPVYDENGEFFATLNMGRDFSGIQNQRIANIIFTIFTLLITLIIAGVVGFFILNKIFVRFKILNNEISNIGNLDFSESESLNKLSEKDDEIGEMARYLLIAKSELVNTIEGVIGDANKTNEMSQIIKATSESSKNNAEEISKAIDEVATGTQHQSESVASSLDSLTDIDNQINEVFDKSNKMIDVTNEISKLSDENTNKLNILIDEVENKTKSTNELREIVSEVKVKSDSIEQFTTVIENIASQTNLLALNASIEAARAGEAGKGFAVVATEIRKLAEESKESSDKIKDLVTSMNIEADKAVINVDKNIKIDNQTSDTIVETKESFNLIVDKLNLLIQSIEEINKKNEAVQISSGSTLKEIENVSAITQESSASAEEVTASAEETASVMSELNDLAEELNNIVQNLNNSVSKFKL